MPETEEKKEDVVEVTKSNLTPEQQQDAVKKANDQAAAERVAKKKAEDRVKELEAADAERVRKEAEAKGEHERLYQEELAKVTRLEAEAEELKKFKVEAEARTEAERKAELEKLPAELRDTYKDSTIDVIRATATVISKSSSLGADRKEVDKSSIDAKDVVAGKTPGWTTALAKPIER